MESVAGHRFVGEEVELASVLRQMIPEGQWYWGRVDGQVSFLGGPLQVIQKKRLRKYLTNRERTQTDTVFYAWSTVNLGWTSRVWSFSTRASAEIGLIQRLVLPIKELATRTCLCAPGVVGGTLSSIG